MTEQPPSTQASQDPDTDAAARRDKQVKIGFVVVALIVIGLIIFLNMRGPKLPDNWTSNPDDAVAQAQGKPGNRPVALLFLPPQSTTDSSKVIRQTLPNTHDAFERKERNYICAAVETGKDSSKPLVDKFKITPTQTPTLVLIDAGGKERARKSGFISQTDITEMLQEAEKPAGGGQ